MAEKWIKVTPGVITGYFKGKRIRIKQNDVIEDAELVKVYPQDFKPVKTSAIREVPVVSNPSSPVEQEPSEAPLFTEEQLEKLHKKELLEIAKRMGIETEGLKKDELIKAILEAQKDE